MQTEDDISEAIKGANGPLRITGGGTRGIVADVQGQDLSVAGLTGITLYEPGALTLVAQAGTPVAEIETILAGEGQRLAFEPFDLRSLLGRSGTPTIGGVIATNASGARRVVVGAARDHLLGVRFVDGAGNIVKNGGRVMKNVTGYDLVKLMAGSHGTLGILTEVSLKVLPMPETTATLVLRGLGPERAVAAMSAALGSPYEVTGAAHRPSGTRGGPETLLRIEGFTASVDYRTGRLSDLLAPFGAVDVIADRAEAEAFWNGSPGGSHFAESDDAVWCLSVRPSDAPGLVARLPDPDTYQLDWGGGRIWARVPGGTDLRGLLGPFVGHATRIRGSGGGPRFHPQAAAIATLSAGLRRKFDPRGILNPQLMD